MNGSTFGTEPALGGLASFAADLSPETVPGPVLGQAALCVLDTVACVVAGADTPEGRAMLAVERSAGAAGKVPVLTADACLPAEAAARLHGYWGDIFELNDLIGGHASIGIVPAVLAAAAELGSSGAEAVLAVVAGIEVASRIYDAVYPTLKPYTEAGLVTPGLVNAFGAAAAVGRLRGLAADVIEQAMAVAGAMTTWCPAEVIFGSGGTIKPVLFGGLPAAAGVRAVTLAEHGVTGPERLLDSDLGLFPTLSTAGKWQVDAAPARWRLANPRRKLHACCGYIHAALDGVAGLRRELGPDVFSGSRVEIRVPAYVLPAVAKSRPPATANEARFHLQYCAALAMTGTDVILPEHSVRFDDHLPGVLDLMGVVEVSAGDRLTHYHQCEIVVRREQGPPVVRRVDGPRGTPQNPLTDDEVRAKAVRLLHGKVRGGDTEAYAERVAGLRAAGSLTWLYESLERP